MIINRQEGEFQVCIHLSWTSFETKFGRLISVSSAVGLVYLSAFNETESDLVQWLEKNHIVYKFNDEFQYLNYLVQKQVFEYLSGTRFQFNLSIDFLVGTLFQRKVWQTLLLIPYGELETYQWIAHQIGQAKAVRAVGSAVGSNPIAIVVPCHRVIRKDGGIGGYRGGISMKKTLLLIENKDRK